jgi:hypothetical protein
MANVHDERRYWISSSAFSNMGDEEGTHLSIKEN